MSPWHRAGEGGRGKGKVGGDPTPTKPNNKNLSDVRITSEAKNGPNRSRENKVEATFVDPIKSPS